jgi:hypothetical protein
MVKDVWCDDCGDIVTVAKPIIVVYPNGKTKKAVDDLIELLQKYGYDVLEILICPECWDKNFKGSRKKFVASMLRILKE